MRKIDPTNYLSMTSVLMLGSGCNFNCSYCLECYKTHNSKGKVLKWEYIESFLRYLYGENDPFALDEKTFNKLHFLGGEPLLYFDNIQKSTSLFLELLDARGFTQGQSISMTTNGYLMNRKDILKYMEDYASMLHVEFSIDGNKVSHDKNRVTLNNEKTFDKVWDNFINSPVKDKVLRWTITTDTVSEYADTIKNWLEHGYRFEAHFDLYNDNRLNDVGGKIYASQFKELVDWYKAQDTEWVLDHMYRFNNAQYKPQFIQRVLNEAFCTGNRWVLDCDGAILKCPECSCVATDRDEAQVAGYAYDMDNIDWRMVCMTPTAGDVPLDRFDSECYRCPIGSSCYPCPHMCKILTGTYTHRPKNICSVRAIRSLEMCFFTNYWIYCYLRHCEKTGEQVDVRETESGIKYYKFKTNIGLYETNRTRVLDVLVPRCWALELIDEDFYDYICDVTRAVGGNVTPLETKFYSEEAAEAISLAFKQEMDKYNIIEQQQKYLKYDSKWMYGKLR